MVAASLGSALYFFPEHEVTRGELETILAGDDEARKLWAVSQLLRYALWEDIWTFISRDEVREMLPRLDLPDNLRAAWAEMLELEAPVR